ncbi:MAG: hypothetical protein FJ197_00025 [Gammaproteobacteria bacterium]|nr:hypothetical protein [Gammaproteobacteria bacterium]
MTVLAALVLTSVAPLAAPQAEAAPAPTIDEILVITREPRYVARTQRDRIGRIWAPVFLNGKGPFRLVLDTGANRSAVIQSVVDVLGEEVLTDKTARLRGVTGTSMVPLIQVNRMSVGDLILEPAQLPIVLDVFGGADGVLGNEGLLDKRIHIDFKYDRITVRRSRREPAGPGFRATPIRMMRENLLAIDIRIGRVLTRAIIDTGAPDSLGNLALLRALKRDARENQSTEIIGVTLDVEPGMRVPMPVMRVEGVDIRNAVLTFGDVDIFRYWRMTDEPVLMLGMDVLGVLDEIVIDYMTRELHLKTG